RFNRSEACGREQVCGPSFSLRQFVHIPVISIIRDFGVKAAAWAAASMAEENSVGEASRAVPHRSHIRTMITSASPCGHMERDTRAKTESRPNRGGGRCQGWGDRVVVTGGALLLELRAR